MSRNQAPPRNQARRRHPRRLARPPQSRLPRRRPRRRRRRSLSLRSVPRSRHDPGPPPRPTLRRITLATARQAPRRARLRGLETTSQRFRLFRHQALLGIHRRSTRRTNVPRKTVFKIGLATAAAAVGAILAITSAFAHGTPTTTGRSLVGTIVNTAAGAAMTSNDSVASTTVSDEATSDAIEAAELAAKIAAEQAAAAAAAAAKAAEEGAEAAAVR